MKKLIFIGLICVSCLQAISQSARILVPYRVGNKWGYSDTLGKIMIQPRYDSVSLFDYERSKDRVFAKVKLKGKPMVINTLGSVIVPANYDDIRELEPSDGLTFYILKKGKFGVFKKGKELFPPIYDYMEITSTDQYKVNRNKKWGLINAEGKIVIPVMYDEVREIQSQQKGITSWEASNYDGGTAKKYHIKVGGTYFYESSDIPAPELEAVKIEEISEEGMRSFINSLKKKYNLDSIKYKEEAGIVYKDGKQGVYLPEGKNIYFFSKPYTIHHVEYIQAYRRSNWTTDPLSNIIADINGKHGVMNESEAIVLPFEYDGVEKGNGFYLLKQNGKIGFFVLNTGYPIISPAYDAFISKTYVPVNSQWQFTLFKVEKNGKPGYVGENGVAYFKD